MARSGEGEFKSFVNGDALTFASFDLTGIRRNYAQRFFVVTNRSVVANAEGHTSAYSALIMALTRRAIYEKRSWLENEKK